MEAEDSLLKQKARTFYTVLRQNSVSQEDPIPEWEVVHEVEGDSSKECICTTPIVYEYTIQNKLNGRTLIIGSECVKRWNIKFTCKSCDSPLGNVTRRLIKKDFLCPECKREEKRMEKLLEAQREGRKKMLSDYYLFWFGKYYKRKFSQVIQDIDYVEYLINIKDKSQTLQHFEEYVNLVYDIREVEIPLVTDE